MSTCSVERFPIILYCRLRYSRDTQVEEHGFPGAVVLCWLCLNKNLNASRSSEHPPVRGVLYSALSLAWCMATVVKIYI